MYDSLNNAHSLRIYVYNHVSQNTQEFVADRLHSNWEPRVCCADRHSNLFVVDKKSKTVCVYFKDEKKCDEVLSMSDCLQHYEDIKDAVVDERGDNIWVATLNKLNKNTQENTLDYNSILFIQNQLNGRLVSIKPHIPECTINSSSRHSKLRPHCFWFFLQNFYFIPLFPYFLPKKE